jgi:hypothetical protein
MQKKTIIAIWAILIIGIGVDIYVYSRHQASQSVALSGGSYVEHAQYYDITANYASSTPLSYEVSASADAAAVTRMKKFIHETIVQFRTDSIADKEPKQTLQIAYLMSSSPNTISYIFTTYTEAGGTHGNTLFHTFTFDTSSGKALTLTDIFVPGAPYLATLSSISRARLPDVIGDPHDISFINDGTEPEEKNFENFFFDNGSLTILFSVYQVAPYSAGPQTLRIPRSELANTLKPEYR